jgi:hypothetical protein
MPFEAKLPEGLALPAGHSINTEHDDYKRLVTLAEREGLTQKQFSAALGYEFERSQRSASAPKPAAATPAPAPARPALPENWSKLSAKERFAHALANSPTRARP